MAKGRDVTIVGAGPVGLVAALYLAKRGLQVRVYEARPDPRKVRPFGGRSINLTISSRGWKALADVGADAAVHAICLPLRGRLVHHATGATTHQLYGNDGECIYAVSRARLARALIQIAEDHPNVELNFGHRLLQLDPQTGLLEFEHAERGTAINLRASVVLAADGSYSAARPSLLRHEATAYRQSYSHYSYKELHIPAAATWPLDPERTHVWPRKGAMLVAFPNLDRSFTATLFLPVEGSPSFRSLSTREALTGLFEGTFPDVVPLAPGLDFSFFSRPMTPLLTIACSPWTWKGKFALIGDSAHTMVPFLGQGMNAGLEDCTVLDECVEAHGVDWQAVLEDYEARRKPDCDVVTALAERHYDELAEGVDDARVLLRKRIELRLHAEHPDKFVPVYTLVTFTRLRYSLAPVVEQRQEPLVQALLAVDDVEERWGSEAVQKIVREGIAALPGLPEHGDVARTRSEPPLSDRRSRAT